MSIIKAVDETIKRYGCSLSVCDNNSRLNTKAFIEPLRYKNEIYIGGKKHILGNSQNRRYLYVGLSDIKLNQNATVIEFRNNKYIVKRSETYFISDCPVYVWAILVPYGERTEDDYESN